MSKIGIVGAGVAGLHLGLFLLQRGIIPTLYSELRPDEMRKARLLNTTFLAGTAREQMRQLGVAHWDVPDTSVHEFDFSITGLPSMGFRTPIRPPFQFIDMRLYLPKLLEDFAERGGRVVTSGVLDAVAVTDLSAAHDLVVVASGRGSLASMFPRIAERSPYIEPQRRLFAGLFRGVRFPQPFRFTQQAVPGHGEAGEFQLLTFGGPVTALLVLAVPGGALEGITHIRHDDDPQAFNKEVLEFVRQHLPQVFARIEEPSRFGALGPSDVLQGAIVPVVRRGVVELHPGRYALALGDAHVTHDPIIGQGANAASRAAWLLGELLTARVAEGGDFDGEFCANAEARLWEMLQPITEWSNAALMPPTPHALELLAAAARNAAIAEEFVKNFDEPRRQWEVLSKPEGTAAFLQRWS
ncbi:MAG TPA: styrene monooxygenase/indole monooxygenase family protein [Polyangia bacterium]|jgi:2-polyprenyl-6-methoxyphenol hydroxylase-like FAD-dependent oxidoreductase|nr:styrene monooxygenase/indole monooxygenase family protein [Polyangia bacterium]